MLMVSKTPDIREKLSRSTLGFVCVLPVPRQILFPSCSRSAHSQGPVPPESPSQSTLLVLCRGWCRGEIYNDEAERWPIFEGSPVRRWNFFLLHPSTAPIRIMSSHAARMKLCTHFRLVTSAAHAPSSCFFEIYPVFEPYLSCHLLAFAPELISADLTIRLVLCKKPTVLVPMYVFMPKRCAAVCLGMYCTFNVVQYQTIIPSLPPATRPKVFSWPTPGQPSSTRQVSWYQLREYGARNLPLDCVSLWSTDACQT